MAYCALWPLQSSSLALLGAMLPVVTAFGVVTAAAAPAVPVRLSWQTTATPIAGYQQEPPFPSSCGR